MKNAAIIIIVSVFLLAPFASVYAYDFDPGRNITLQDLYSINNGVIADFETYYGDGSQLTGIVAEGGNASWNESYANTLYRRDSWDNLTGIPHATPSDGDVTHFSLADEIYDWVIGLAYATTTYVDSIGNWTADKSSYYLKTEIDTQGEVETIWSVTLSTDTERTTTNTSMKNYVDAQDLSYNTTMTTYVDGQDTVYNSSMKTYVDATNTTMTSYVDTQDSAQDECSEISGCIENAITDGNTNWDNSYGLFDSIENFTGTLTSSKWCIYDGAEIDCNVDPVTDTTYDNSTPITLSGTTFGLLTCADNQVLKMDGANWKCEADDAGAGTYTFNLTGDSGTVQVVKTTNIVDIAGGTNGIDTVVGATDTVTINLDWTEVAVDTIAESKISFSTSCAAGNHYYLNGNDLACEADDDTTYTAGAGLVLTDTTFTHNDSSSQASSDNSARTYIQDIILDTYGHIQSIVTATETVVDTDTQDLSYNTETDVISLTDGGSIDITEVDTDTTYTCSDWAACTDNSLWDANKLNGQEGSYYQTADATLTDIADGTIIENLVNTNSPWADNEVSDTLTCSNLVAGSAVVDISTETNLEVGTGITLTGDTLTVVGGTAITTDAGGVSVTADAIGDTQLEFNTGQHLATTNNVAFQNTTVDHLLFEGGNAGVFGRFNGTCTIFQVGTTTLEICP